MIGHNIHVDMGIENHAPCCSVDQLVLRIANCPKNRSDSLLRAIWIRNTCKCNVFFCSVVLVLGLVTFYLFTCGKSYLATWRRNDVDQPTVCCWRGALKHLLLTGMRAAGCSREEKKRNKKNSGLWFVYI